MNLQIFGTKKCQETKKAERFFKERGIRFQLVDLAEKEMSPGEFAGVAKALGVEALVDTNSARYRERGMAHLDCDLSEELLGDWRLMKTPIVRDGSRATVGYSPSTWTEWLKNLEP